MAASRHSAHITALFLAGICIVGGSPATSLMRRQAAILPTVEDVDGSNGLAFYGQGESDMLGASVACGDVNGDGYSDMILGATGGDGEGNAAAKAGETYVVFGTKEGLGSAVDVASLDGSRGFVIYGRDAGDQSGQSVASGDVNGDGLEDIIIGSQYGQGSGNTLGNAGEVAVVFGRRAGWPASVKLSDLDGTQGFTVYASDGENWAGHAVSSGDVNGDGFADLVIGAKKGKGANGAGSLSGETYVVFGKASGWAAGVEVAGLDGSNGFAVLGQQAGDEAGSAVACGDVNGDGFDDVVIGVPLAGAVGDASPNAGEVLVVFGRAVGWGATVEVSSLDGIAGCVIYGRDPGDRTGHSVALGDVNGDGWSDIIIGAQFADGLDDGVADAGETYVMFGKATGRWAASYQVSSFDGTSGFVIHGAEAFDQSGASVSSGDVNRDGYWDVLIGAIRGGGLSNSNGAAGEVYLVYGKEGGWGASVPVSSIDGTVGRVLYAKGDVAKQLGNAVAAGDFNGDGFSDVVAAASLGQGVDRVGGIGEVYLVFGGDKCGAGQFSSVGDYKSLFACSDCAGGTFSGFGATGCVACDRGSYSAAGSSVCSECEGGYFSSSTSTSECPKCVQGTYSAAGASFCYQCGAGTFASIEGTSVCLECEAGTFATGGSRNCTECAVGTFSQAGSSACSPCPAGVVSVSAGAKQCSPCQAGTFSSSNSTCDECEPGTYSPGGLGACLACSDGCASGFHSCSGHGSTDQSCSMHPAVIAACVLLPLVAILGVALQARLWWNRKQLLESYKAPPESPPKKPAMTAEEAGDKFLDPTAGEPEPSGLVYPASHKVLCIGVACTVEPAMSHWGATQSHFTILQGALPKGLALNTATGAISGTPQDKRSPSSWMENQSPDEYSVTIKATNDAGSTESLVVLRVATKPEFRRDSSIKVAQVERLRRDSSTVKLNQMEPLRRSSINSATSNGSRASSSSPDPYRRQSSIKAMQVSPVRRQPSIGEGIEEQGIEISPVKDIAGVDMKLWTPDQVRMWLVKHLNITEASTLDALAGLTGKELATCTSPECATLQEKDVSAQVRQTVCERVNLLAKAKPRMLKPLKPLPHKAKGGAGGKRGSLHKDDSIMSIQTDMSHSKGGTMDSQGSPERGSNGAVERVSNGTNSIDEGGVAPPQQPPPLRQERGGGERGAYKKPAVPGKGGAGGE